MRSFFPDKSLRLCAAWTGRPLTEDAMYRLFKRRILAQTGHDLTLHDVRRIITTSISAFDLANAGVASQVLGYLNERVTGATTIRPVAWRRAENDGTDFIDAKQEGLTKLLIRLLIKNLNLLVFNSKR